MAVPEWVPMEWPASWGRPEDLARIKGSPVNCLLFSARADAGLRDAAKQKGIEVLQPGDARLAWHLWKDLDWAKAADPVAIKDGFWPQLSRKAGNSEQAGPTGAPWLDSNGWLLQLARSLAPGRTIWIKSDPPENVKGLSKSAFLLAVLEAWAYGGRRPVWIPADRFDEAWPQVNAALQWMKAQTEWGSWPVPAALVVVSDFAGPNEYTGTEVLNLAARQNIAWTAVEKRTLSGTTLHGRKAVLWIDADAPAGAQGVALRSFVQSGGLVLCLKSAASAFGSLTPQTGAHPRFHIAAVGKGRVAIAAKDWDDPWTLASDAHLLTSRRWDLVRVFNPGSLNWHYTASPDGKKAALQILNYSFRGAGHMVSLKFPVAAKSARFFKLGEGQPHPLELHKSAGGPEVWLPSFDLYSAVELEL